MAEGVILFIYPLFMFFIAGFIVDKIQPKIIFLLRAFLVAGGGFFFILLLNSFLFPGAESLSVRNPVLSIYTPAAFAAWAIMRFAAQFKK